MIQMLYSPRRIPVLCRGEVVVAGAGVAGVAAAIQAARANRRVILLEKNNCAGGILSSGLLPSVIHMSDGEHLLASGICREMVDRVAGVMNRPANYYWFNAHPEAVKRVLDEMLQEAHVTVLYNVHLCDALAERGRIRAVVMMTPNGLAAVGGKIFIDATGDGLLAMLAGAPFEYGAAADGEVMAPTLCSYFTRINFDAVPEKRRENGLGRKEWKAAMTEGRAPLAEGHFVGLFRNGPDSGTGNLGHIYHTDVLDPFSLSHACVEGRKQAWIFRDFFRKEVPGFEQAELSATAGLLGVRESRRIMGEYMLNEDDYASRRHFEDEIGCFAYAIDIHSGVADVARQTSVETVLAMRSYAHGENYGIPYRTLLPKQTVNLLVAGRCISTDRAMQSSIRVVPGCMITGQAAGAAAALALDRHQSLRRVSAARIQELLRRGGCYLP